jgi:hypothetical protein
MRGRRRRRRWRRRRREVEVEVEVEVQVVDDDMCCDEGVYRDDPFHHKVPTKKPKTILNQY